MTLHDLRALIRRGWPVVLACVLLGGILGAVWAAVTPITYTSTSHGYVVVNNSGTSGGDAFNAGQAAQARMASYVALATTPAVTGAVAEALELQMSPQQIADTLTVSFPPGTLLLDVTATAPEPQLAADIAAETLRRLQAEVAALETPAPGVPQWARLLTVEQPTLVTADRPLVATSIAVGAVVGLIVGVLLAAAWTTVRRRVDSPQALSDALGRRVVPAADTRGVRAAVVAAGAGEGRAVAVRGVDADSWPVARDLAASLAAAGDAVLLLDARAEGPGATEAEGMEGAAGLSDLLDATTDDAATPAVPAPVGGAVRVLPAGTRREVLPDALGSARARRTLHRLAVGYDVVVVDGPVPTGARPDGGDAVDLVVVGLGRRSPSAYREATGDPGVVVTVAPEPRRRPS